MAKRFRAPTAKPNELLAKYGKSEGELDIFYCWNGDHSMKRESRLLMTAFERVEIHNGKTLRSLLDDYGYDITTFKFSIFKKPEAL